MALAVDDKDGAVSARFLAAVDESIAASQTSETVRVAFDCEGVNLSRIGTLELVAVCFLSGVDETDAGAIFLVDLNQKCDPSKLAARVQALKKLFECPTVRKVIHDCRMDCDALYHIHGINLTNVHATSCFHAVRTGSEDVYLNNVLASYGIAQNETRDKSVYKRNTTFGLVGP
jgi:exonuclease 3'-5' domain-containing protein 1